MPGSSLPLPLATALLVVALPGALPSSRATLAGTLRDASSERPVVAATVRLTRAGREVRSDSAGAFSFGELDVGTDTLIVEHPEYHPATFVLGESEEASARLRIRLRRRRTTPVDTEVAVVQRQLQTVVGAAGATVWTRDQFEPFLPSASHPLDLLLFSGLVERIGTEQDVHRCVELPGGEGCAMLLVNARPAVPDALDGRFAAEVESFVVLAPGTSIPSLGVLQNPDGLVIVFLTGDRR